MAGKEISSHVAGSGGAVAKIKHVNGQRGINGYRFVRTLLRQYLQDKFDIVM